MRRCSYGPVVRARIGLGMRAWTWTVSRNELRCKGGTSRVRVRAADESRARPFSRELLLRTMPRRPGVHKFFTILLLRVL